MNKRILLALAVLVGLCAPASAQLPVQLVTPNQTLVCDNTSGACKFRLVTSAGTTVDPDTKLTYDTPLTRASTTGGAFLCLASAAAPTNVGGDDRPQYAWCLKSGAMAFQPTYAGVLGATGFGAPGTDTPRVVPTSNGANGSAAPAQSDVTGAKDNSGFTVQDIACTQSKIYDASTTGSTEMLALSGSLHYYICHYEMNAGAAVNGKLTAGTGTNCGSAASGTPSTGTSGANAALTPAWQLAANGGTVSGWPTHGYLIDAGAGNAVCFNASGAVAAQVQVWYALR